MVKSLSRYDGTGTIVIYMSLFMTPMSLLPALWVWRTPSLSMLGLMLALGFLGMIAHVLFTRAFQNADASAVQPFDYARLPFVAILAFVIFGEVPDAWIWPGAGLIVGAAVYIAHREAQAHRAG